MRSVQHWSRARRARLIKRTSVLLTFLCLVWATPAPAAIVVVPQPTFPARVTVGETFAASLAIGNFSTPPDDEGRQVISDVNLVPACANTSTDCGEGIDAGVFSVSTTGTGTGPVSCTGTWTVTEVSPGVFHFTPPGGEGTLELGPGESCSVAYMVSSLRVPTVDVDAEPGAQTNQVASASVGGFDGAPTRFSGASVTTVLEAQPTLRTSAPGSVALGGSASDTATLAGGFSPTGTITFTVYGPDDATCAAPPAFSSAVTVDGNGSYTSSSTFTPPVAGTYRWVAAYSGDANNAPVTTSCGEPAETTLVEPVAPSLSTTATPNATVGETISDTATLSESADGTGTLTFRAFGPDDDACGGPPAFESTARVTGDGAYSSDPFTPSGAGFYRWVASYSGDANNLPVTTPCDAVEEISVVFQAVPAIVTSATRTGTVGRPISDTATLAGGFAPTGTITFRAFGPDGAGCDELPAFTSVVPVQGEGNYSSGPFTPTATGTYQWVASYSGDANNVAGQTECNDVAEATVVATAFPTLTTSALPSAGLDQPVSDTATLAGGFNPTGTITFTAFGPDDTTCSELVAFRAVVPVEGNGEYSSGAFTPGAAGTYRWVASYSGDVDNAAVATACDDPNETTVVATAAPDLTTTATANALLGQPVADIASLSGGFAPTGTLTFTVFGPDDATCAGEPVFASTVAVAGNGSYDSEPFTPTAAGVYRWVASYSGDMNNAAVVTGCGDPSEVSVVAPTTSTTSTTSATSTTRPPTTSTTVRTTTTTTVPTTTTTVATTTTVPPTTTTTVPPATATTAPPPTSVPATTGPPPPTVPPRTGPPSTGPTGTAPPTTLPPTAVPATTVTGTTTPTTSAPPTTTPPTTTPAPPGQRQPLTVLTTDGKKAGPPGVGLNVTGSAAGCKTVHAVLDGGPQIGSAKPGPDGAFRIRGVAMPGDADVGVHTIATSCSRSGDRIVGSATFEVAHADVHRSGLMTSLPQPRHVSTDIGRLTLSAALALLLIPLLAFPFQLFNSTLEENYDEVRGWFGLRPKETGAEPPGGQGLLLVVLLVASGLLYALLSPDFGLNQTTLVSAVGLAIAVLVTGVGFSLPGLLYRHHHNREWGRLRVLPGTILVAAFTVAISRLLKFQPGYVYGLIATFAFRRKVTRATEGRLAAVASALILLLTLAAWIGRVPVAAAADGPHPGLVVLISEVVLGGIFLLGLESLLIDLLPMRFLDGSRIIGWSRAVWAALFMIGLFALVHVLLVPGSGYVGHTEGYAFFLVMALFVAFGLASTAFWAYFRYREPPGAETAETAASL